VTSPSAAKVTLPKVDLRIAILSMNDLQLPTKFQAARFGDFSLDLQRMELRRANQTVELSLREFKVLKFMVMHPRIVLSRQKLISSAWPRRRRATYRTVDNCIAKLRQKIESNPGCPLLIRTIHGVGYKFVPFENPQLPHHILI
jgi:DNA-binding response OmpR family regulator